MVNYNLDAARRAVLQNPVRFLHNQPASYFAQQPCEYARKFPLACRFPLSAVHTLVWYRDCTFELLSQRSIPIP